ncbi:MAG: adenylosuccinate synthase [Spirochaetales bacterium]|nr:adenylosuccinate synthase [Spirochaetales bacterium]
MAVSAVVGANWGDEGKGKLTDYLAKNSDMVIRFQGGKNAGHTIINDYGKFALHLLPSGVFYKNVVNVLGPGVAIDVEAFYKERDELLSRNVPEPQLKISNRAQIVLPYHILFDVYEEERLANRQFGSTKSGIAPFYADKYLKVGVQIADLYHEKRLVARLEQALELKNVLLSCLYNKPTIEAAKLADDLMALGEKIRPFVCDSLVLVHDALKAGKNILLEGQLGALRDPDYGIYPFSTSSSTLAGFGAVGAGIPPREIKNIIAVTKAYSSCVGAGPFVSEIFDHQAHELRERGGDAGEYGATTGRPRRMGWFDAVATRYGCMAQGATEVELSMLDVLGFLDEIPVCTHYEINGKKTRDFPVPAELDVSKPVYEILPGWKENISAVREFSKLPRNAQDFVIRLEEMIEVPIKWISVGPQREAMIRR